MSEDTMLGYTNTKSGYQAGVDILRAIACGMVVFIHMAGPLVGHASPASVVYLAFFRVAVPLFFMVTGYLLLDREENIFFFYKKRMMRIVIPTLFFAFLYNTAEMFIKSGGISIIDLPHLIFLRHFEHLWFMYILVGVYLFMPFLRKIYIYSTIAELRFFLLLWAVLFTLLPVVNILPELDEKVLTVYGLQHFSGQMGYVLLGGYLKRVKFNNARCCFMVYISCVAIALALTLPFASQSGQVSLVLINNRSPLMLLGAIALFLAIINMELTRFKPVVQEIAKHSFGIYLIHAVFVKIVYKMPVHNFLETQPWLAIPFISMVVFVCSFVSIKLIKKIKYVRIIAG